MSTLSQAGFIVNLKKSLLTPTQDLVYIGGQFNTAQGRVTPPSTCPSYHAGSPPLHTGVLDHSGALASPAGSHGCLHQCGTTGKTSNEEHSNVRTVQVEVSKSHQCTTSSASQSRPPHQVVDTGVQSVPRFSILPPSSQACHHDGCILTGLGRSVRRLSPSEGVVEQGPVNLAYKQVRTPGRRARSMSLSSSDTEPNSGETSDKSVCHLGQCKASSFCSLIKGQGEMEVGAMSIDWAHLYAYAFPPTVLLPRVLNKIILDQATVLLIGPKGPDGSPHYSICW